MLAVVMINELAAAVAAGVRCALARVAVLSDLMVMVVLILCQSRPLGETGARLAPCARGPNLQRAYNMARSVLVKGTRAQRVTTQCAVVPRVVLVLMML